MLFALLNDSTDSIYFKDHRCRFVMVSRTKAEHLGLLATAEWGTNLTIVSPVVMEWGRRRA